MRLTKPYQRTAASCEEDIRGALKQKLKERIALPSCRRTSHHLSLKKWGRCRQG